MRRTTVWLLPLLFAVLAPPAWAQDAEDESPYEPFAEVTEGATVYSGFFDIYEKGDDLWLAIPEDRLGEDFLMEMKIAQGVGAGGLFGGTMLDYFEAKVMSVERHGERLFLVQRPHRFRADDDERVQRAVELTFSPSIVESAEIVSVRDDGALLIPIYNWFVSDLSNVGQRVQRAAGGNAQVDRSRSYVESVKSFPRNTNLRTKLTFRPNSPGNINSVPDNRSISISVHYTLAALPEIAMTPRLGDDRVGNFLTVHKDFSSNDTTFFVRYVNKWRLEPGERVGDKIRPREPITYYIDPNVPDEYRQVFKDGVEAWNAAFEAAGWVDAIRALDLPEDADAEDIRYATLRWNVSDNSGYGAIGPSIVDPRTGEILDADILFEANMFLGHRNQWRNLAGQGSAAEAFEQALGLHDPDAASVPHGAELPGFASAFIEQGAVASLALMGRDELGPQDPVPTEFLMQAAHWVVMHEVGHTLGLQHNFRSSASTPLDRLHDREWAEENGVFSSVMEYPTVNIAPPGEENGYYYNPGAGSYDKWAISYAYTPDPARAAELARQVADRRHMYGNESGAFDPSINTYDLSADPVGWAEQRTAIAAGLWPRLTAYAITDNDSYNELTGAFRTLIRDYSRALSPAVKYIGGQYMNRDHVGDPNGRMPFENVPVEEQRAALDLIIDRAFRADAFDVPQEVIERLGTNHWSHWGQGGGGGRPDFSLHDEILGLQRSLLSQLHNARRLARVRDGEAKFGANQVVTIPELFGRLRSAVWSEVEGGAATSIPAIRRDLQRAHLDELIELVVEPADELPADARAVARLHLRELGESIQQRLGAGGSLDMYTLAHLDEAAARIAEALDPGE